MLHHGVLRYDSDNCGNGDARHASNIQRPPWHKEKSPEGVDAAAPLVMGATVKVKVCLLLSVRGVDAC